MIILHSLKEELAIHTFFLLVASPTSYIEFKPKKTNANATGNTMMMMMMMIRGLEKKEL